MMNKKIIQTTLGTFLITFSQLASAQCAQQVQLDMGKISEQLSFQDEESLTTPEMNLDKKYDYLNNVLSNKTHLLLYKGTKANGNTRICYYQSNETIELKAELKQTEHRSITLKLLANQEILSNDNEYHIYHNQIVLGQRLTRSRNLNQGTKIFEGTLQSRNHYSYSCGFRECTYTNDEFKKLAKSNIQVSWN